MRCLVVLLFAGLSLHAQEFRGTILGRVQDTSGAVVPGASIAVTNVSTNTGTTTKTGEDGSYAVPFLIPGFYRVAAEAPGFKRAVREGIEVRVQDRLTVDLVLEVGATTETISVVAGAPLLEPNTATLGQVIENRQIVSMPLNGRNSYLLTRLAPGAQPTSTRNFTRPFDNGGTSDFSLGGNRGRSNEVLLDGITNVGADNVITFIPSIDATQEFKVQTNSYDAEFGRTAGGVVNVTIKSGSNQPHGSVFDFLRNEALDANNFFNNRVGSKKAPLRYNQFGASLGGPVFLPKIYNGRDQTFFFFSYEGIRQKDGRTFVGAVPTLPQREGDFSQTFAPSGQAIQVYDPLTTRADPARPGQFLRDLFPGNRIPRNRWDPVAAAAMEYFPRPSAAGNPLTGADNLFYSSATPDNYDAFIIRMDHQFNETRKLFGRVSWSKREAGADNYFANVADSNAGFRVRTSRGAALDYLHTIGPRWVLNLRYGFTRFADPFRVVSEGFDITQLGLPASFRDQTVLRQFPRFDISGLTGMGRDGAERPAEDTQTFQGSMTHLRGAHSFKWGGDYRIIRQSEYRAGSASGRFSFSRAFTQGPNPLQATTAGGHALASFLLGTPASGSVDKNVALSSQNLYFSAYGQDDWKVARKLTLSFGLRYEREGPRTERFNRMTRGFAFGAPSSLQVPGLSLRGGLQFAGVGGQPRGQTETDNNTFAPRFGFAYQLGRAMVLRGGYGVFWSGTSDFSGGTSTALGFSASTAFVASLDGITPLNFLRNPFPQGLVRPAGAADGLATLVGQSVSFVAPSRRVPYTQQYSLSLQRQFGERLLLEAAYVGNRGTALANSNRQMNQIPDSALAEGSRLIEQVANPFFGIVQTGGLASRTVSRGQLLRPYPQFTGVTVLRPTVGSATYHSLQLKAEKRFSRGLSFLLAYTNSKLLDDIGSAQNNNFVRAERSLSTIDRAQRFVLSGIWDLPFGRGRALGGSVSRPLDKVISGWQINWITTFQSGQPLGITSSTNTTNSFGGGQRPNSTGQSALLEHSGTDSKIRRYFNTSAFVPPLTFTFGNVSRTLADVRGPGINNFDLSLLKSVSVRERVQVQFRAEFFNAFNRTEFGLPGTSQGTAQFGTINSVSQSANPARQAQMALKVVF